MGCWDQAQAVLQPVIDKAQDAFDADAEEEETDFTGALEAVLFQLVALSLQAAWHLQHPGIAADMYTLCSQFAEGSEATEERASRFRHLVAIHLKYVAHVVNEQCSVQQLQQSWSLLQQSASLIDSDMTCEACRHDWIRDAKNDVCGCLHSLCSLVAQAYLMCVVSGSNSVVSVRLNQANGTVHNPAHARVGGSFAHALLHLLNSLHCDVLAVGQVQNTCRWQQCKCLY